MDRRRAAAAAAAVVVTLAACALSLTAAADILAIFPFSGKSHFHMFRTIADALVERGHNVTVVGHFPRHSDAAGRGDGPGAYTDYSLAGTMPVFENITTDEVTGFGHLEQFLVILQDGLDNCEAVMSSGRLDRLVRSRAKFDVVVVEIFNTACFLSVANHFGAPIVGVTSTGLYPWYAGMLGDVIMPSYVPVNLMPFTSEMTFFERLVNSIVLLTVKAHYKYTYEPKAQEIIFKYLGELNSTVSEAIDNVDVIITNTHFVFGDTRPTPPGIIEVGGCAYRSPKPLPEELETYITSAELGVVYFSMGSILKGSSIPVELFMAMLQAFGRLKGYKVLWKWEDDLPPPDVRPKNVKFMPWMPQFDVLNHPNVKLFISHGGLMGILDSLYSGVPVIGIPIFAEQFFNVNYIVKNGCGRQLQFDRIDEQTVFDTITAVLENDTYRTNAKHLSRMYRDRDRDPLATAVYWIEYVARHSGGLSFKPAALFLRWYELYLVDVFVVTTTVVVAVVYLTKRLFASISRNGRSDQT